MASDATFRFFLFGPPALSINDQGISLPRQPATLCAFLILNRQRRITREEIQAVFWPDVEPARVQERLRRTLYLLRKALHPHTHLIISEGNELAIAPDADLWVDYDLFEAALMDAYRDDPPRSAALVDAVALYTDDLLKDVYADWALLEREHASQRFLTAVRHLLAAFQRIGQWENVVDYAHLLLEHDPLQEVAHQALMMAFAAQGNRSAAMRQYEQCVQWLDEELAAEPLPGTTQLYDDIRQGRGVVMAETASAPRVLPPPSTVTDLQHLPLVGREAELDRIAAEWHTCQGGTSRLLLVTGSAGMGKTRLVQEAAWAIPGPDVSVITGNCYAMEAGTPYQLIADLMRKAVDLIPAKLADALTPAIRAGLAQLLPDLDPVISVPLPQPTLVAPDVNIRVQEAVTQVIRLLAASGSGLWLITEDLHWADPASLACLNHALRRCDELPLLVLATLRDEEVPFDSPLMNWPASSVHTPAPTTLIRLAPLPRESVHHLLALLLSEDPASLAPLVHHETAGNPFFVVETLRALVDQNVIFTSADQRWHLRRNALDPHANLPLSDAALDMIRGRVRRLSRPAQEVLTVAAIIEHDIDESLLEALIDPAVALDLALEEILYASILDETAPGLYQFLHIKVREIIYADTSSPRRRFLHRQVADFLAKNTALPGKLATVSRLAYHYAQARAWTPALRYGWQAAQTAVQAGAMAEANRYAVVAQTIVDEHLPAIDTSALPENLPAIRFDLLALQAEFRRQAATAGLYYPPDLVDALQALVPQVDDSRRARAALQQATHLLGQGALREAKHSAEEGRTLYAQLGDRWGELDAIQHQIDLAFRAGDMVTMRHLLDDMRALAAAVDHPQAQDTLVFNDLRLAVYNANWIKALKLAQRLSATQRTRLDPAVKWQYLAHLGLAFMKLGAHEEALIVARQAVRASTDARVLGLGARVLLARLQFQTGNLDQSEETLRALLETPDPLLGEGELVAPALALTRCCAARGDHHEAAVWAGQAAQAAGQIRLPILVPLAQVAGALADLAAGEFEQAARRLSYPLEFLLLVEDTSPQEIFTLRAAAAQGNGDVQAASKWLTAAWDEIQQQATTISDTAYRDSFLRRVPLHRFVAYARRTPDWKPVDLLTFHHDQRHDT
ncbi:MAG: AAA family ATPase [Chloroflexi bacterium]|nr:AAA family ATPase [Chloroflexota bacterium]